MSISLLLDAEEVLDLKQTVLLQVGAVHCVDCSGMSKFGPYSIWPQVFGNLRICRPAKLPEWLDSILLSDFENDARSSGHVLYHAHEFWQHSLVHFEEFFSSRPVKSEHFHRWNLKAFLQYHVDDLSSTAFLNDVWLNNAGSTIIEGSCWCEALWEEESVLSLEVWSVGTTVASISCAISSEQGS